MTDIYVNKYIDKISFKFNCGLNILFNNQNKYNYIYNWKLFAMIQCIPVNQGSATCIPYKNFMWPMITIYNYYKNIENHIMLIDKKI